MHLSFDCDDAIRASPDAAAIMSSNVSREDLSWLPPLEECQLGTALYPDVLVADEESGRICFMLLDGDGVILSRHSESG